MIKKIIKFLFAGFSNTLFSYLIYLVLIIFFNYLISYLITTLLSIIYIYKINTKFVFNVRSNSKYRYLFFIIYSAQIFANIMLLKLWVEVFMLNQLIAPLLNIAVVTPITFLTCNLLNTYLSHSKRIKN